tara:strand:- start:968 stop:1129 length:162 start_codon:yes stop_codon:yes gene_type:complete
MKKEKIETANKILEIILQSLDEHMYGDVPTDHHNLQALITQVEIIQGMLLEKE